MAYSGLSGQYGDIPSEVYLRKIEQTDMEEDPMQVEDHLRSLLIDRRPDPPFFESDQIRRDYFSTQLINLRDGGRLATASPDLPDGTFLDQVFLERDPRGNMLQPDMRQMTKQGLARGKLHNFKNDADYSMPETGINPVQMVANIKSGFYQVKDRLQIFDESFDNWNNGGSVKNAKKFSDVARTTSDGTVMDIAEQAMQNRADAITKLSNDPTMAYRHSTTDNRFKIAHYGLTRMSQSLKTQNWRDNRASAYLDHDTGAVLNGERYNKMLAMLIVDLQSMREQKQVVAQGSTFGESDVAQNQARKITPEDLYKIRMITGNQTHAKVEEKDPNAPRKLGAQGMTASLHNKTEANHSIAKAISRTNKAFKQKKESDLREEVKRSGFQSDTSNEQNGKVVAPLGTGNTRQASGTQYGEDSKVVKQYGGIIPMIAPQSNVTQQDREAFGSQSDSQDARTRATYIGQTTAKDYEQGQQIRTRKSLNRYIAPMGDKAIARYHSSAASSANEDMQDIQSGTRPVRHTKVGRV